ncbi:MAG: PSD1 and planctomycete cytochrome C domain-containing protein [Planctomycetaceae bacterium]
MRPLARTLLAVGIVVSAATARSDDRPIDFGRDIRPILSDKCFFCHGPDPAHREADLRLDWQDGVLADRGGYAAVVPGKPDESELIARITADDESMKMPPAESGKSLSPEQIELLRRWIEQGAEWEGHWAYEPLVRPVVPAAKDASWPRQPIDRFVLARLDQEGLTPSPDADRVTLIRRLSFDLTGLPPTADEVDRFLDDRSPDAYERLVERLLASPHFGERMAVYWLDLVRYADTVGYHGDQGHHIQPYRDYVIKSFNENLPFDQFTREQLAGDLLPNPTMWQTIASGYNRVLQTTHEGGAQDKEYLAKYSADRVRNASSVWLGSTLACAECHDHKFDPLTQKDFYTFAAFFADVSETGIFPGSPNTSPTKRPPERPVWNLAQYGRIQAIETKIASLYDAPSIGKPQKEIDEERAKLIDQRAEIEKNFPLCMVTVSQPPRPIRVLPRGDWMDESSPPVDPAVPAFLSGLETEGRATRLDLANWICSDENPLTARVFANRTWKLFFGRGLSGNLDDVGAQGEAPSHPELLDWLAVEFRESGWDVKHLVRTIVTSRTYRQSSLVDPALLKRDPQNRLLARQGRSRLPAEFVRDNALAISGLLVPHLGGESARPYQPEGYYGHLNFPVREYDPDEDWKQYRRGVYMHWQRQFLHPMLRAFDAPSREICTAERPISNTPLAALVLLNAPTFLEAARVLAARAIHESGTDDESRLRWLWRHVLSREATSDEIDLLRTLLEQDRAEYVADREAAAKLLSIGLAPLPNDVDQVELASWTGVARAVLNLNETLMRN